MNSRRLAFLGPIAAALLILNAGSVFAGSPADPIEVVQSVPLETNLSIPGIRETQEVWLEMIAKARTSLDLEQFYVSDEADQALAPVLQAIQDAAARGVHVRLLVDHSYYLQYPDSVNAIAATPNCEARQIDYSVYGGVQHAKYFVIDGTDAFVGSQNFDWRALSHIHEVGLRVSDTGISAGLESVFQKDWAQGTSVGSSPNAQDDDQTLGCPLGTMGAPLGTPLSADVSLVASPAQNNPSGVPDSVSALTNMIDSAHSSVRIQVMEYTTQVYGSSKTWKVLDKAIRSASARGVQVQLMVDVSSLKTGQKDLKALSQLKNIQVLSVTIPQYSGGPIPYARLIHSKYMIVDGTTAWVGSENWSESYFTQTRDVGLVVHSPQALSDLNQIFEQVWNSGYGSRL